MGKLSKNSQFIINLFATVLSNVLNYGISFLFTPYLVRVAGGEAYGFVNLANNMVNYATIITIALSSVAGRYIAIKVHKGERKEANQYFNSVLGANIFLAVVIGIVFCPIIIFIQKFLDIPQQLVANVKGLFTFVVLNFMITITSNVFQVATFITNQLYLTSLGNCISSLLRVFLLWMLFSIMPANVMYIGITSCICSLVLAIYNMELTRKLKIGLIINKKFISWHKLKELLKSGIWSSVTKLSQVLSDGLDLLICNIWIGAYAMGQLSIAYTIPMLFSSLLTIIASLFNPQQTYYYAKGDIQGVVKELKFNMKISGYFTSILFAVFFAYGFSFFQLWTPQQNTELIYQLSLFAISSVLVSGVATALNSVFLLTDHLKVNSLVWLGISVFDSVAVILLAKYTLIGIYAVAGFSKIVSLFVNTTYVPIYASKCLMISKKTFYPIIGKYLCTSGILLVVIWGVSHILPRPSGWVSFLLECGLCVFIGMLYNFICFLNKKDRKQFVSIFQKRKRNYAKGE